MDGRVMERRIPRHPNGRTLDRSKRQLDGRPSPRCRQGPHDAVRIPAHRTAGRSDRLLIDAEWPVAGHAVSIEGNVGYACGVRKPTTRFSATDYLLEGRQRPARADRRHDERQARRRGMAMESRRLEMK